MSKDSDYIAQRIENMSDGEFRAFEKWASTPHEPQLPNDPSFEARDGRSEESRAFSHWLRTGDDSELRSMNVTVDPSGGYLVPQDFQVTFVEHRARRVPLRAYATVIQTTGDAPIPVPNEDGEAYWLSENQAYEESDETFSTVTLGAHKLGRLQKVSEELIRDSGIPIDKLLARLFGKKFAVREEAAFFAGTGVGQPTGFLENAEIGKTTASNSVLTADEIFDTFYSVDADFALSATWFGHPTTLAEIRKLKDGSGAYLWEPSVAAGQPPTLLGRPIVACSSMPTIAASAKVLAVGDFSYYWIGDRGLPYFQPLFERYADQGQIGFRMYLRTDGKLTVNEAVKVLQMHA